MPYYVDEYWAGAVPKIEVLRFGFMLVRACGCTRMCCKPGDSESSHPPYRFPLVEDT